MARLQLQPDDSSRQPDILRFPARGGAGNCDLFIAVTPYESNNIVACSIAKNLGAARTVARIDTYDS